jgi:preprotein translocase subunit SecA
MGFRINMLINIPTSTNLKKILSKPQLSATDTGEYYKSNTLYYNCLTKFEQLQLTEKLNQCSDGEVKELWQNLLAQALPWALRQFLNINQDWPALFKSANLKSLNKIFGHKEAAALFCQLINDEPGKSMPLNALMHFGEFIESLEQHGIKHLELVSLMSLSAAELYKFLWCFKKAKDKEIQLKFATPVVKNIDAGLKALANGYSFINQDMLWVLPQVPAAVLFKAEDYLNYILNYSLNDVTSIRSLSLLYIAYCNLPKIKSLSLLDNLIASNKISANTYNTALKFALILNEDKALNLIKNTVGLIPDKFFNLIKPSAINEDGLVLLNQAQILYEYITKMQLSVDLSACRDLDDAVEMLENTKLGYIKELSVERKLDEVIAEFGNSNPNLFKPLNEHQLKVIKQQYLQIKAAEQQILSLSQAQMLETVREIKGILDYTKNNSKEHSTYLLMAIANRVLVQYFNLYPHQVQTLTVLAMLLPQENFRGRLAQVKTGEGKSTIITLFALVLACQGKCVDIITSNPYLAKRDEVKYKQFFNAFEISTSNLGAEEAQAESFAGQIIYGTSHSFEFSILMDKLYLSSKRVLYNNWLKPRLQQAVIVDEVDNMFVDKALNSARIAYPGDHSLTLIYPLIYDYIRNVSSKPDYEMVVEISKLLGHYTLPWEKLSQLVNSAYEACYQYQLNIHYCLRKVVNNQDSTHPEEVMEVVIIEQDTGRLNEGSRWQNGLHQFIEYKHNLPLKEDNLTLGLLSHPAFFNGYSEIYGVTGTIGTDIERQEIVDIYNIDSFDVPTNKPLLRQHYNPLICKDKKEFHQKLINEITLMLRQHRPCLLLCPSIEISHNIYKLVKKSLNISQVQLLNAIQTTDEEFIVANAGNQALVTIATNAAGRGTDIPLSSISIKHGGLHVIFTFFPANERIEEQGAGRAARQGAPGSYRIIVPHDDELLLDAQRTLGTTADISIKQLNAYRKEMVAAASNMRRNTSLINLIQHELFEQFCAWYWQRSLAPNFKQQFILNSWAKFYTQLDEVEWPKASVYGEVLAPNDLVEYKKNLERKYKEWQRAY